MLISALGDGGAARSFVRLGRFLSRYHEVRTVFFVGKDNTNAHLPFEGDAVVLDDPAQSSGRIRNWVTRWRKLRELKREHDVCISFYSGANLLNALACRKTPAIVSERTSKAYDGEEARSLRHWLWSRVLDPLTYRLAHRVVPVSLGLAEEIRRVAPRSSAGKIVAIEGYVDSAALVAGADKPVEPEFEALGDAPLLVSCGRLHPQKGFQRLIPIFARVKETVTDARLLIIGEGPQRNELVGLCNRHGLAAATSPRDFPTADVVFAGYREDPNRYFRLARLFVLSSLYEGLPNTLIEAMAAGLPLIAADCPCGARSVLSEDPVAAQAIPSDQLPVELDYGLLMPRIDRPGCEDIWAAEIISKLRQPVSPPTPAEARSNAIARFDITHSGLKWLKLVQATK